LEDSNNLRDSHPQGDHGFFRKETVLKDRKGEHPFGDAGQAIGAGLFLVVWIVDSFFLHRSTFLQSAVPLWLRIALPGALFSAAAVLFRSGHEAVAHEQRPVRIIRTGAFRYVRHPLYLSSLLVFSGLAFSTASLLSAALFLILFVFYDFIAGYEEKIMEAKFGADYRRYRSRTGKWLPRFRMRG
jgi:protein-S-isoprenylcysteine O-methyltransferase Ste14